MPGSWHCLVRCNPRGIQLGVSFTPQPRGHAHYYTTCSDITSYLMTGASLLDSTVKMNLAPLQKVNRQTLLAPLVGVLPLPAVPPRPL